MNDGLGIPSVLKQGLNNFLIFRQYLVQHSADTPKGDIVGFVKGKDCLRGNLDAAMDQHFFKEQGTAGTHFVNRHQPVEQRRQFQRPGVIPAVD